MYATIYDFEFLDIANKTTIIYRVTKTMNWDFTTLSFFQIKLK